MKKKFLAIAALTCAVFCIGGAACKGTEETSSDSIETPKREKVVTIADFETWETGIQLIRTGKYFGTINENTDPQYVKSGQKSALLHPLGGYRSKNSPIFFFPTVSETYNFDHSDFSDADKVTFEFYNAEETDVDVAVGLITSVVGLDAFQSTALEYQPLKSGWNTVTYTVDVSTISINADVTDIQGIYVGFKNASSRDEADAPDIYLDDVILYRKDEPAEIKNLVNLEENEYCDFEKDWQKYTVSVRNTAYSPTVSIVNAEDYKVGEAPAEGETDERATLKSMEGSKVSGNKVLRVCAPNGSQKANSYPGIQFAPALLQESLFGSMKEEDYGRVTFAFDIYNNSPERMYWGVSFYNIKGNQRYEYGIYVEPYSWTPFSVLVKDLYDAFKETNKNSTSLFTEPGSLHIYWAEFVTGDKEFFFDNFRYEVEERDMEAKPTLHVAPFVRIAAVGDRLELPIATATDKYDLKLETKLSVQEEIDGEWKDVTLESGLIPITHVGNYRIIASSINSLKNETKEVFYFRGVESVEDNLWNSYEYADEASNVYINGEKAEDNQTTWLESVTLGGETKNGVVKAVTNNADIYGSGYIGLRFAKQRMDDAADANWDYFTISVYIEATSAQAVKIYSFNTLLAENVPTGCWTEIKITKADLNAASKSRVNGSGVPYSDTYFYESFYNVCGVVSADDKLLFVQNVKTGVSADTKITYYIDKVTWGAYDETWFENGDDVSSDIYDKEWVDPWIKKYEEE